MNFRVLTYLAMATLSLFAASALVAAETQEPVPRNDRGWLERHAAFNKQAQAGGYNVVFLGDSLTHAWELRGKDVWAQKIAPLRAVNFGISGDQTRHVLWRLQNGNLDGRGDPRVIVLMAGTNDTGDSHGKIKTEDLAANVKTLLDEIRKRKPRAKILVLGIFPRGANPDDKYRKKNEAANALIAKFADNKSIFFRDIGKVFLEPDGTASRKIFYDSLHLTKDGYERWADAVVPEIKKLITQAP
ncbi:MAG: GDSL-type esterase/lipase family protein [Puniceicoccales bacterium]|jgi:beta-glucosidase|nr:GDSL-type esterase/lipase family protein [Puniceicoccales bacterium]